MKSFWLLLFFCSGWAADVGVLAQLHDRATELRQANRCAEALRILHQATGILTTRQERDSIAAGTFRTNLALTYLCLGRFPDSARESQAASRILDRHPICTDRIVALTTLAQAKYLANDLPAAERNWLRALDLAGETDSASLLRAGILTNLAVLSRALRRLDEAEQRANEVLAIRGDAAQLRPRRFEAHHALAMVYFDRGDLARSEDELDRATLDAGDDPFAKAEILRARGQIHFVRKRCPEALLALAQAGSLDRRNLGEGHPLLAVNFKLHAGVMHNCGYKKEARTLKQEAGSHHTSSAFTSHIIDVRDLRKAAK